MAICLVTGAAGFIGSRLSLRLLKAGHDVRGVDAITDYYDPRLKRLNLVPLLAHPRFRFEELDLRTAPLERLVDEVDYAFHLAGQPGVRPSWGSSFSLYLEHNILATQRLLEALVGRALTKLVFASSSSVYGSATGTSSSETDLLRPESPYGVTKAASELLCLTYAKTHAIPATALRYFTVYGPGQRPDMAIGRFLRAALSGAELPVFGDGEQRREFTYVDDVVQASMLAAERAPSGIAINVGGGECVSVLELLERIAATTGRTLRIVHVESQAGDVLETRANLDLAERTLGWRPVTTLSEGLAEQWRWLLSSAVALERVA